MKKFLLILLTLSMIATMAAVAPLGVGAEEASEKLPIGTVAEGYKPEGKPVASAEDFANMEAGGSYYLAGDIAISATYKENFTGVFDGNGKTITTTVPLFGKFNGQGKNLVIKGAISVNEEIPEAVVTFGSSDLCQIGAFANTVAETAETTIENIRNEANITSSVGGMGGIAGAAQIKNEFKLEIKKCANYGNLVGGVLKVNADSGGILGMSQSVAKAEPMLFITDCENYGVINAAGRPGGIMGCAYTSAEFKNCFNKGEIQSTYNYCGGICGRVCQPSGDDKYKDVFLFEDCVNEGKVIVFDSQGGGICGYTGSLKKVTFRRCINRGDVTYNPANNDSTLGGIFGYGDKNGLAFEYDSCVNYGKIGDENFVGWAGGIVGYYYDNKQEGAELILTGCENYGDVVSGGGRAGGIVAQIKCKPDTKAKARFTGCVNHGAIKAKAQAAGIAGAIQEKGLCALFEKCGNTGYVCSTGNNAGGIVAYCWACGTSGPSFTGCFNTGTIESTSTSGGTFVGGIIAYFNNAYPCTAMEYNMVGGKMISHSDIVAIDVDPAEPDKEYKVVHQQVYKFTAGSGEKYFRAPAPGNVKIVGTKVTFVADTAFPEPTTVKFNDAGISVDDTGAQYKIPVPSKLSLNKFTLDGDTYVFMNPLDEEVGILKTKTEGGKVVPVSLTVNGRRLHVVKWEVADNTTVELPVFDHDLRTTALFWSNNCSIPFDPSKNIVEEGVADLDYAMGVGNKWNILGGMEDGHGTRLPHEAFTDGTVAATLNGIYRDATGKKEDLYYQNLMATIFTPDEYPTTDARHAKVILSGGAYTNQIIDFNDNVTPPTGDAAIYVVITLAVSSLALAVLAISRKKKAKAE